MTVIIKQEGDLCPVCEIYDRFGVLEIQKFDDGDLLVCDNQECYFEQEIN